MAKYLIHENGYIKEQLATETSSGAGDAGKIVALNAQGKLDNTLLPTGIGAETKLIEASETLDAGSFVNVWNDAGTVKVRKADASTIGKEANGFVLAAFNATEMAEVYFEGINNQLTGLTPGTTYFLSAATPGDVTATAPSGSGNVVMQVGRAISATEISFEPTNPIVLA